MKNAKFNGPNFQKSAKLNGPIKDPKKNVVAVEACTQDLTNAMPSSDHQAKATTTLRKHITETDMLTCVLLSSPFHSY